MNTKQIATRILARRNSMASIIPAGALTSEIGGDGIAEALRLGWIAPNFDSGGLQATNNLAVVREMEKAASEKCSKCDKVECECEDKEKESKKPWEKPWEKNESRKFFGNPVNELLAFGSGQPDRPAASPVPPPDATPAQPAAAPSHAPASNPALNAVNIGDSVLVAEGGETYLARVSAKNQDGSYKLSFGAKKPARDRAYKENELRKTQDGADAAKQ